MTPFFPGTGSFFSFILAFFLHLYYTDYRRRCYPVKRTHCFLLAAALLLLLLILRAGIGPYTSSSAVQDLTQELVALHGEPYSGHERANGTEDMVFSIESKTFFLTDYNLRSSLGLDYRYTCKVIYTTYTASGETQTRTVTYTGLDPMGKGKETARAYIDTSSAK